MHEPPTNLLRRDLLRLVSLLAFAESSEAQDAAKVQPQSYRVAFENDKLRVLDYNSRPGMSVCGSGLHSHPAHLTVIITGGSVRITTRDGKSVEQRDIPAGVVFWSDPETHITENIGGSHIRMIVELKSAKM